MGTKEVAEAEVEVPKEVARENRKAARAALLANATAMKAEGFSVARIADQLGVKHWVISNLLKTAKTAKAPKAKREVVRKPRKVRKAKKAKGSEVAGMIARLQAKIESMRGAIKLMRLVSKIV